MLDNPTNESTKLQKEIRLVRRDVAIIGNCPTLWNKQKKANKTTLNENVLVQIANGRQKCILILVYFRGEMLSAPVGIWVRPVEEIREVAVAIIGNCPTL